ncbi:hypothetical protein NSQ95_15365 [Psychrobacillus sp. FSL W7-1457]|uniref:hypothetical protein n=1 Tax=Psychrobacillus sp. FSL W7-1457 TaxID=2954547 RepID=UPI00315ACF77
MALWAACGFLWDTSWWFMGEFLRFMGDSYAPLMGVPPLYGRLVAFYGTLSDCLWATFYALWDSYAPLMGVPPLYGRLVAFYGTLSDCLWATFYTLWDSYAPLMGVPPLYGRLVAFYGTLSDCLWATFYTLWDSYALLMGETSLYGTLHASLLEGCHLCSYYLNKKTPMDWSEKVSNLWVFFCVIYVVFYYPSVTFVLA